MASGPAPMMRRDLMSVRFGICSGLLAHHGDEPVEQMMAVARTRARLGMVLHREGALRGRRAAFVAAVEQADMGDADALGQRLVVHREAVILAGDLDLSGREILHRLIGAAMAEIELVGARA